MKVIAADFVLYPVKDMAVAQKFYRDTLGLTVYNESDGWSKYDLGNVTLSIVNSDISSEAGESPVCHHATITDPDGNIIWIHHRKDGTSGQGVHPKKSRTPIGGATASRRVPSSLR
jgi:extradiol dioxygenase family protein